ncbi:MAG TPA: hypothetical protein VFI81_05805, partial [Rhodanobacteraceae bacterium]|nr:hypothetical protein [Rhodanobacteraceae bacterium]
PIIRAAVQAVKNDWPDLGYGGAFVKRQATDCRSGLPTSPSIAVCLPLNRAAFMDERKNT